LSDHDIIGLVVMQILPVVRSSSFAPIAAQLRRLGVSVSSHFEAAGIPLEVLDAPDVLVPEHALWKLLDNVRTQEGIVDIGFRVGASHHVTDVEGLGELLAGQSSLFGIVRAFCERLKAHSNLWDYWTEPLPGGMRLCRRSPPIDVDGWPVEQYVISYLIDLVRTAAPPDWTSTEIWLETEHELVQEELRWLPGAQLHLASPVTAIFIPDALLARKPNPAFRSRSGPGLGRALSTDFREVIRDVIKTYLVEDGTRLERVAAGMGMRPRTLQRRLAADGLTFQRVLDEARLEIACERLEAEVASVYEISAELGYRQIHAFSKSFKRWTGVSPTAYRQANRGQQAPLSG
jgi:AraC-like DNA-binding protein